VVVDWSVPTMSLRSLTHRLLGLSLCLGGGLSCHGDEPTVLNGLTQRGVFEVEVRPSPDPIPLNVPFELSVLLRSGADSAQALPGRTLLVEGWMPGHGHGMLRQSQVEDLGDGRYRVRGMLFHMPGSWELRVKVIETRIEEEFRVVEDDELSFVVVL